MTKSSGMTLRLLGAFAVEANAGRRIPVCIRSKKARALLAYLAMKPDYRASREELATLLWGDNPDSEARHSLRQCLTSLRQDFHLASFRLASEVLCVDREAIGLCAQDLTVDAREFMLRAKSAEQDELALAAALWRGEFLAGLALDVEEFDAWRRQERDRLATAAARVFEALCKSADARSDGEAAIAAAERLVALEPTREDRQRAALLVFARYRGREEALGLAKRLTDLLQSELDTAPEPATRTLIDAIRRGDLAPAPASARESLPAPATISSPGSAREGAPPAVSAPQSVAPAVLVAEHAHSATAPVGALRIWPRRPMAAAVVAVAALVIGTAAVLAFATGAPFPFALTDREHRDPARDARASVKQPLTGIVVLPFAVDTSGDAGDLAFARMLTHDLIGYLARFGNLRLISDWTSDLYRDHQVGVARVGAELGVPYAIAGQVQGNESGLRVSFQLVDTATRLTLWSSAMPRERGDPVRVADEAARGMARAFAIRIGQAEARRMRAAGGPQQDEVGVLVAHASAAEQRGPSRENLSEALTLFEQALHRDPHHQPAMLGVARIQIVAVMNFVELDPAPDLDRAERLLNDLLGRSPGSAAAYFNLGLLQKHRGQFEASVWSFQRCLDLNPSFLPAEGQMGHALTRIGEPGKGLEIIQQTMRVATPNDPVMGMWYLFAADAELELGHDQAALDWMLRANAYMPNSPLARAWLAAVYATIGDAPNAAKQVAAWRKVASAGMQRFMGALAEGAIPANGRARPRIFEGLRLAFSASLG
jgi:DNA-binding SARP family transcriptional activator/TolB-like protein